MVEAITKAAGAPPVRRPAAVRKKPERRALPSRKPVMKRVPHIEKFAKAIFHFNEVSGGTMRCTIQGVKKEYTDGQEYTEALDLFERMNEECRVVKRKHVAGGDGQIGAWVETKRFEPRLWWEIVDRFDKKTVKEVVDEEATANQE